MEKDFSNCPPFMSFDTNDINGFNDIYKDPMFNPIMQYEQAYSYYKYLNMQMEYKIKCKEYEKICTTSNNIQNKRSDI